MKTIPLKSLPKTLFCLIPWDETSMKHTLMFLLTISFRWWFNKIGSGVVFFEFSVNSSYSIFIVDIRPDLIPWLLKSLYSSEVIVVLPLVPVTPIKSIFEEGLPYKLEEIV